MADDYNNNNILEDPDPYDPRSRFTDGALAGVRTPQQPAPTGALSPKYIQDRIDRGDEDVRRYSAEEDAAYKDLDADKRNKMAKQQEIMESVSNQQPDRTRLLAAISAGFLKPTRTGGFSESLGNVGEYAQAPLSDIEKFRQDQKKQVQALGLAGLDLSADMSKDRAALARSRAERGYKMTDSGIKMLEMNQKLAETAENKRLDRESREDIASGNQSLRDAIVKAQIEARAAALQAKNDAEKDKKESAPPPVSAVTKYQAHEKAQLVNDQTAREVDKWLAQIKSKDLDLSLFDNMMNTAKTSTGWGSDVQSRAYSTFTTGLKRIRNDLLSLQTGTQTESDARRIMDGIIENINDPGYVIEQLGILKTTLAEGSALYGKQMDDIARQYRNIRPKAQEPEKAAAKAEVIDFDNLPSKR